MNTTMQIDTEWSWEEKNSDLLTSCRTLQPINIQPSSIRSWSREFGIQGIQFGSWDGRQVSCLNTDIIGLTDGQRSTESGCLYRVDNSCYFIRLDARVHLPFADQSFKWVYAEHFIEHLNPKDGIQWLSEIWRILAPGGLLRLTTPDLHRYLEGYLSNNGFFTQHRKCLIELGAPEEEIPERKAFMVNQIFHFYGHRWIYDMAELRYALRSVGFRDTDIVECTFHKGAISTVAEMDRPIRSDESIYIEARR